MNIVESSLNENDSSINAGAQTSNGGTVEPPNESSYARLKLLGAVIKSIILNPIVFMTVLGIVGNLFFDKITFFVGILKAFGSAFSATALFVLGLRMVGTVQKLKGDGLLLPGVLIAVKLLVLPLVTREVTSILNAGSNASETLDLSTFGFLYGTFPTAPAVFVFSTQYNLEVDLISSAMVACTFISAPLMFISAKMTFLDSTQPNNHFAMLESFGYDLGIAGLIVGVWVLIVFVVSHKIHQIPHRVAAFLVLSQVIICIGALLQRSVDPARPWTLYIQFSVLAFGIYSARVWAALLAITLLIVQTRTLCFVLQLVPYYVCIGWGVPIILIMMVGLLGAAGDTTMHRANPYFVYGNAQAITTLIILIITFLVTSGCLVMVQRQRKKQAKYMSLLSDVNSRDIPSSPTGSASLAATSPNVLDIEDLTSPSANTPPTLPSNGCGQACGGGQCSQLDRETCSAALREYRHQAASEAENEACDPQIMRHVVLLLLTITSMFVGIMLSVWTLMVADLFSGIYLELSFLDVTLTIGQIFFSFAVFGLDAWSVVSPIVKKWRRLRYGTDSISLPPFEDLSFETTHVGVYFLKHYERKCEAEIAKDIRVGLVQYKSCFRGSALVDWMLAHKLTKDRMEAATYCSHLVLCRILFHVERQHYFNDNNLLYTFRVDRSRWPTESLSFD